jgi:protein O-GlcNAc transferase
MDDGAQLLQAAIAHHRAGRLDAALAAYERFLRQSEDNADAHYYLGMLHHQAGRHAAACRHVSQSLALSPDHVVRWSDLGAIQVAAGDLPAAIAAFKAVVARDAARADVWAYLGDLLRQSGKTIEAIQSYAEAVQRHPDLAEAHLNLGLLRLQVDDVPGALAAGAEALRLRPDWPEAHNNLGSALKAAGRSDDALRAFRTALLLRPDFPEASNNLALTHAALGKPSEALEVLESLLAVHPDYAVARVNLGDVLRECGRVEDAEQAYLRALRTNQDDPVALWNLGNLCWQQGLHADAARWYAAALKLKPDDANLHSNLLYARLYDFSLSQAELLEAHREYSRAHEWHAVPAHTNSRDADRVIRVGYVSADFRVHPVAHFLQPLLSHHDRSKFHVTAYANQRDEDDMTRALRICVDAWVPCLEMSDEDLARRIHADAIDILVDLSGHTAGNRLPVLARKPAPVQFTWLSYPGTTGLSTVDYRITDAFADPPGAESGYAEALVRLPDSLCCYQPAPYMPEIQPLPLSRNGFVTFASFNNYNKLTDECLAVWARILVAVPDSRILIAAMPAGKAPIVLRSRMERLGIAPGRISTIGKLPGPAFVQAMQDADIALDPFPLTGGTTTMETLWMGLPTVMLCGDRFISRVGASFLTTAGMAELIARSVDEYVSIACHLAASSATLEQLRGTLRSRLAASPLLNAGKFTDDFEAALREAWRRWCLDAGETSTRR